MTTLINHSKKKMNTATRNPGRQRTNLIRGNFLLFNEKGDLKLFSEPSDTGRKGVVFEKNKKVMAAFPRVKSEVVSAETDMDTYFTPESVEKGRFYDHHEGALIRVYWASGAWQVSTQKKIDAFRSRWGSSQSYGDLWAKAVDEVVDQVSGEDKENVDPGSELPRNPLLALFKRLNQKKQYLFLVRNNADNRLVCDAPETSTMYHVGTYANGTLNSDDDIGIAKPTSYKFSSAAELKEHILSLNPSHLSGCIGCVTTERGSKWYKFQNDAYCNLARVRGNEPSLRFRYLQVRLDGDLAEGLYSLFPSHASVFDECEDSIYSIAKYIHRAYMDRFIRRQFVTLEREFFSIMRICHEWHKEDRQHNKVDLDKVIEVINTRYDYVLNKMIRVFKTVSQENSNTAEQ
jgi:hypothetical protein